MFGFLERRSAVPADATEQQIARAEALAVGVLPRPDLLAVAEAATGLWERALASAEVSPSSLALQGLTAPILALMGRSLAARGGAVFKIMLDDDGAWLIPASSWDVQTGTADPRTWIYRCDLIGPSGSMTENLPADAVVHVRLGADTKTPWKGQGPLQRAKLSGELTARIESALIAETKLPVGRIAPYTGVPDQLKKYVQTLILGGMQTVGATAGPSPMGGQEPASRLKPQSYGPEPDQVLEALRSKAGQDIVSAFGVPPSLFNPTGDGAGQREAWRRFWAGTIAPVGAILQAELRVKLDAAARVGFEALRASDEDGRSRATQRRANAYKIYREAGMGDGEAKRLAGLS